MLFVSKKFARERDERQAKITIKDQGNKVIFCKRRRGSRYPGFKKFRKINTTTTIPNGARPIARKGLKLANLGLIECRKPVDMQSSR